MSKFHPPYLHRLACAAAPMLLGLGLSISMGATGQSALVSPALTPGHGSNASPFVNEERQHANATTLPRVTPTQIQLPALESPEQRASSTASSTPAQRPAPQQIGLGRPIAKTEKPNQLTQLLRWEQMTNGDQVAALQFTSTGAKGVRLGLEIESIDPRTQLKFSGSTDQPFESISGLDVLDTIFKDVAENPKIPKRNYISPYFLGPTITLEITLPAEVSTSKLKISIPFISHIDSNPEDAIYTNKIGESGSCNIDITCKPEWSNVGKGVALILFTNPSSGKSYICTGSLINDKQSSETPYFLTANHCVSDQATASTIQSLWFYQASSCGSGSVASGRVVQSGGGTLLYTAWETDTTFLRMKQQPPAGAWYQGWAVGVVNYGASVTSVHHPKGDVKKISTGNTQGYFTCGESSCTSANSTDGTHISTSWSTGTTESGSSGSGLFININGNPYLIGQLTGGNVSCTNPNGLDFYGRFDTAYSKSLSAWLSSASTTSSRLAIYRFYNTSTNSHFFTGSTAERDYVISNLPQFKYEGQAFYAYPNAGTGLSPVMRFYNSSSGSHFYTISSAEKDGIVANLPQFRLEGSAWFAKVGSDGSNTPLYRFFNQTTGTHFYTVSSAERDYIIQNYSNYKYEGIAYYVWLTN